MNIGDLMTANPVTISPGDSLLAATRLLKENGFKHLPVIDEAGQVVGVVTDRDLKRASASDATMLEVHELLYLLDKVTVNQIMSGNPVVIDAGERVESAAGLLVDRRIGCLPVLKDSRLAGIITKDDLLRLLSKG